MAQQPSTLCIRKRDATKPVPVHVRNSVVPSQPFVDERVVRVQQAQQAAILAQLALHEQLGLLLEGLTEVLVELGEQLRIGHHIPNVAHGQPLAGEIVHQRLRAGIGNHAAHLLFQDRRILERGASGHVEERVVGNAAPQEKRQPRGQLEVADAVDGRPRFAGRVRLDTEQEPRADKESFQRKLDARLEASCGAAGLIEAQQGPDVFLRDRPTIGTARERGKDLSDARFVLGFVGAARRLAHEDSPAREGILPRTGDGRWTADRDARDRRVAVRDLIAGEGDPDLRLGHNHPFELPLPPDERHADDSPTGLHREPNLEIPVHVVRIVFPFEADVDVPAVALRRSQLHPLLAADRESLDESAVQTNVELMLRPQPLDVPVAGPLELDPDFVLAVGRKEIRNRGAAPRPERQVVVHAVFLHHPLVDPVLVEIRGPDASDHESADPAGRRQIALHEQGRDREDVRVVVEPMDVGVVSRQQRPRVDLEAEQVADGVDVLGPIQTMDRRPAGIGTCRRLAIERGFQPGRELGPALRIGPRSPGGRHRVGAQLAYHLLPHFRAPADIGEVGGVELEPGGSKTRVVTGDAVSVEERALCGRRRLPVRSRRTGCPEAQIAASADRDTTADDESRQNWTGEAPRHGCFSSLLSRRVQDPSCPLRLRLIYAPR